jgi:hypothetical protein
MSNIYFETFGEAIDGAIGAIHARNGVLISSCYEASEVMGAEPINYNQTRTFDFPIEFLKGKPTRKYYHVSIYRMPSGRYELTTYVL